MLEALDKLMKEYKKNLQKTKVRAIGRAGVRNKESQREIIIRMGEQESKVAEEVIGKATAGLQSSVKGQFGKKVTEVFDKQKQTLAKF